MKTEMKHDRTRRLPTTARVGLLVILAIVLLLVVAVAVGFSVAMAEHGGLSHKPAAYLALAIMLAAAAGATWGIVALARSFSAENLSGFDKRYYKMWGILIALGVAGGVGFLIFSDEPGRSGMSLFSNAPIEPGSAIALAALAAVMLVGSAILYHRTIDDHEERAYLWGSTMAFYFIFTAFPVAWLLARGGLIDPLEIGSVVSILVLSLFIQAAVWLWFKFR